MKLYQTLICLWLGIPSSWAAPLKVVVSFSVLQNMVEEVGGDLVCVESLVPPNRDPHTYQPTTTDGKNLKKADLVFVNGLTFEGWLDRLIKASGFQGPVITVTGRITPRLIADKGAPAPDPHAWHAVDNGILYIEAIRDALIAQDPDHASVYRSRSLAFIQALKELDQEIRSLFAAIPLERRKVVTTHDAFWYFGQAYQVEFLSPVGVSTEAQASAKDVACLVEQIRTHHIQAVFLENLANKKLIRQIAEEANVTVEKILYADSLSEKGGPADTYITMMRHNAHTIADALNG